MDILDNTHVDLEDGGDGRHSAAATNGSPRSSDLLDQSPAGGTAHGTEIVGVVSEKRESSASQYCSVDVDEEGGLGPQTKVVVVHVAKSERDCRICHMGLDAENQESGGSIELGCSCKDDLAVAHKHCAEAWFKIKGNKTCEICGSTARNVAGANEAELMTNERHVANDATTATAPVRRIENTRNFWQGHRFLNILLACMVFAFVISWLFHFHVPS